MHEVTTKMCEKITHSGFAKLLSIKILNGDEPQESLTPGSLFLGYFTALVLRIRHIT